MTDITKHKWEYDSLIVDTNIIGLLELTPKHLNPDSISVTLSKADAIAIAKHFKIALEPIITIHKAEAELQLEPIIPIHRAAAAIFHQPDGKSSINFDKYGEYLGANNG